MSNIQDDVAELLNISQKRAGEITQACYDKIAELQLNREHSQIGKAIDALRNVAETSTEQYYTGFIIGQIVQTHLIANYGLGPFLGDDLGHIEKAKDELKDHPEFG